MIQNELKPILGPIIYHANADRNCFLETSNRFSSFKIPCRGTYNRVSLPLLSRININRIKIKMLERKEKEYVKKKYHMMQLMVKESIKTFSFLLVKEKYTGCLLIRSDTLIVVFKIFRTFGFT